MPWNSTRLIARVGVEDDVEEQMAAFVGREPDHHATQEATDCSSPIHTSVVASCCLS